MIRIICGAFALLNAWLCILNYFTDQNVSSMILEALFTIVFYITFLLIEEDSDE